MVKKVFNNIHLKIGAITIFTPFLFFAINAIFSIEYSGFSDNNSYIFTLAGIFFIFIISHFRNALVKKVFFISDIFFYFFIIFIFFLFLFDFSIGQNLDRTSIFQYILIIVPVALFALDFGKVEFPYVVYKYFFLLNQIILLSIVITIPKMLKIDVINLATFYGGGHYQGFGYIVSFSFLINLVYFLFFAERLNFFYKIYFFFSFAICLSGATFSGARGSMLVIFVGALLIFFLRFNIKKFVSIILKSILILFVSFNFILFYFVEYSDRIIESADRIFSYISDGTIDMSKTSNRDILYEESIKIIKKSLFTGYGFFDYLKQTGFGYPHNIFLEILLQGGLLYLIVWIIFLAVFFYKFFTLIKKDKAYIVVLPFVIYSFIQLLFSGTYMMESFLWFSILFTFTASSKTTFKISKL